jgi:hypothetical protein
MAKRFAGIDLPASTLTDLTGGGVGAGLDGSYQLNIVNRGGVERSFRVAITGNVASGSVGLGDYVEYEMKIEPQGVFSRWPIPLSEGDKVWVFASGTGLSVNLLGMTEA